MKIKSNAHFRDKICESYKRKKDKIIEFEN